MRTSILLLLIAAMVMAAGWAPPAQSQQARNTMDSPCLFPSTHKRFAITVGSPGGGIDRFDVTPLAAGGYLNWGTRLDPSHPTGMDFYQMIRLRDLGDVLQHRGPWPNQDELLETVEANPASAWIISNEAEYRWSSDSATPEEYAQTYHDLYSLIKGADPSAQIAINAVAAVTPLRLAWLDRAWSAYRDLYGTDMPVDIWTIHNYVVNEMVHEWGIDLPKGFSNAVGYGAGTWTQMDDPAASGGTVHRSRDPGARAYFAFSGDHATLYLRTGPSSGIATIYLDKDLIDTVDLYAPQPGGRTLSYDDLPADHDPQFADRHHLRVQVTGQHNPASGDTWIQVDALEAPSTAGLPQGRLEDDDPLQAQVVVSADSYDDLDTILAQIRTMRGWMANHGQQHKPLINTEYGVIIGEDLGFDYGRVRDFMLDSFDLFLDDQAMVDPAIGMPEDGGRLLQQWFWFILAMRHFDGALIHTGLYDPRDHLILPLGQDYGAYLGPLVSDYADLETTLLTLKPGWPLFAGEPSLIQVAAPVRNRGNLPSGPFWIWLVEDGVTVKKWYVWNLSAAYEGDDTYLATYDWQTPVDGDRTLTSVADSWEMVDEPCEANNQQTATVAFQDYTDLALDDLVMTPPVPTGNTTLLSFRVSLRNLGSRGTAAQSIRVDFWDGAPEADGTLIYQETLLPGQHAGPATVSFDWDDFGPGHHDVMVQVQPVPEETNLANNRVQRGFHIPSGDHFQFIPALLQQ